MSTTAQVEANRRNAQQSTGPRTVEGKATVARNAVQHGFRSGLTMEVEFKLLDHESRNHFMALHENLCEEYEPDGPVEAMLVERLAVCHWRQRRLANLETQLYLGHEAMQEPETIETFLRRLNQFGRYEKLLARQYRDTQAELRDRQHMREEFRRIRAMRAYVDPEEARYQAEVERIISRGRSRRESTASSGQAASTSADVNATQGPAGGASAGQSSAAASATTTTVTRPAAGPLSPATSSSASSSPVRPAPAQTRAPDKPNPFRFPPGELIARHASPGELAVAALLKQGK